MAKTKKPKETITPSDDLIFQAIAEGQAPIAEGKTKVEAAMAIYRHLPVGRHELSHTNLDAQRYSVDAMREQARIALPRPIFDSFARLRISSGLYSPFMLEGDVLVPQKFAAGCYH